MDKKKINIAIEQLQKVHKDMNDCANRFILKDAIDQLQEQVKNCSIPVVSNSVICCPQCGNERLEETGVGWYICCDKDCDWGDKL